MKFLTLLILSISLSQSRNYRLDTYNLKESKEIEIQEATAPISTPGKKLITSIPKPKNNSIDSTVSKPKNPSIGGGTTSTLPYTSSSYLLPYAGGITLTSPYGYRLNGGTRLEFHKGTDLVGGDKKITSIADGTVVHIRHNATDSGGWGNMITIRHSDETLGDFCSLYAHLTSIDGSIKMGSQVKAGQTLGVEGGTSGKGKTAYGSHLHFQTFLGTEYNNDNQSNKMFEPLSKLYKMKVDSGNISPITLGSPGSWTTNFYSKYSEDSSEYQTNYKLGVTLKQLYRK